jgi:predicted SAM-dependent methyltransferase
LIKLHLGCGKIRLPGYTNIDIMAAKAADLIADLRALPYADGSVDLIYSCAAIEHLGRREWASALKEWARVLKPSGTLRLSTADFEAAIARYNESHNLQELLGLLIGGQKDDYDWHGMIFDFDTLAAGLREAGFANVRRYDWRQTEIGRLGIDDYSQAYLPHMDKESGRLMMLNVEATRTEAG